MPDSAYQLAIYDALENGAQNIFVDAKAGSGKTTTIVNALNRVKAYDPNAISPRTIRLLAFNKAIADNLQTKVPAHVTCSTYHSLGMRALNSMLTTRPKVEGGKLRKIVWNIISDRDYPDTQAVIKLVGLAKNSAIGCQGGLVNNDEGWRSLIEHYDLDLEEPQQSIRYAIRALEVSYQSRQEIDFDDMVYMPIRLGCRFTPADLVCVDEAQDTNALQIHILKKLRGPATRFLFVGDPHQAIYGFRGAGSNAIEQLIAEFQCKIMPLSVCYRCGSSIVKHAQLDVPEIESYEGAVAGNVLNLGQYVASDFHPGDAVLCRNVAPLVSHAFALLARDVPCVIAGRDIGQQLVALAKRMGAQDLEEFRDKLKIWYNRELEVCAKEQRSPESVTDKYQVLSFFAEGLDESSRSMASLIAKIELMFVDATGVGTGKVLLSSIHKAKGLEWERVFFLDHSLIPSPYAKKPWQAQQEQNLRYVAKTRAKNELVYIASDCWKEESK